MDGASLVLGSFSTTCFECQNEILISINSQIMVELIILRLDGTIRRSANNTTLCDEICEIIFKG